MRNVRPIHLVVGFLVKKKQRKYSLQIIRINSVQCSETDQRSSWNREEQRGHPIHVSRTNERWEFASNESNKISIHWTFFIQSNQILNKRDLNNNKTHNDIILRRARASVQQVVVVVFRSQSNIT